MVNKLIKISCIFICLALFIKCNQKNKLTNESIDPFKNIKDTLKKVSKNINDSITYCYYYSNNKKLILEERYKYDCKEGIFKKYYDNGNIEVMLMFKNNILHGAMKEFSKYGIPMREKYFINGEERMFMQYYKFVETKNEGLIEYYIVKNDTAYFIGKNLYKDNFVYDNQTSTFYDLRAEEEIIYKNKKAKLIFSFNKNFKDIHLIFGNINSELELLDIDTNLGRINITANNKFTYEVIGKNIGIKNITGLVLANVISRNKDGNKDTIIQKKFPIYKDILVIPPR